MRDTHSALVLCTEFPAQSNKATRMIAMVVRQHNFLYVTQVDPQALGIQQYSVWSKPGVE